MRKIFLVALLVAFGCSSSSGGDGDLTSANAPVMDDLTAPDSVTENADKSGWTVPITLSFHDDHENVNSLTFSAAGANPSTLAIDATNKQVNQPYTFTLLARNVNVNDAGVNVGYRAGTFQYAVSANSVSGVTSNSIHKTIVLQ